MADNSSNNSSGPRNWRERIGVKGSMPKIADEFNTEPKAAPAPQPDRPPQQAAPAQRPPQATRQQQARPAPVQHTARPEHNPAPAAPLRPVARPAPMAPRRPVTPARPAPPRQSPAPSAEGAIPSPDSAPGHNPNAFGDRLRAQRQAAEELAKKRAEETRSRLSGATASGNAPRFSFAEEEIKAAEQEKAATPQAAPPAPPVRRQGPAPTETAAAPPPAPPRRVYRPVQEGFPKPYQPSDVYRQTHGYREYGHPAPVASPPPYEDPASDQRAQPQHGNGAPVDRDAYTPPYPPAPGYEYQPPQPVHSPQRTDRYRDDLYDEQGGQGGQGGSRPLPRRAAADDYSAAYRDYDEAFDDYDEEPRSRSGIWIFIVLMLIVVAAIAAGAYWFINYGTKIGADKTTSGNVPTVTAPQDPVKVTPAPADTTTPGAPVRRKKIYDRILGDQTLEPEKLIPSEEPPATPPTTPAPTPAPEAAPTNNSPIGVEPLPLPLPPPPTVPGVQGSVSPKANKVAGVSPAAAKSGQTTIAPTSASAAKQNTAQQTTGGQQAPLALPAPALPLAGNATAENQTTQPQTDTTSSQAAAPIPRSKPASVIAQARQAAEQRRLAALTRSVTSTPGISAPSVPSAPRTTLQGGSGPVQITPGTGAQNFNASTPQAPVTPPAPRTNIASLPQPTPPQPVIRQPVTQPQTATGGGYVLQMSSFRNREAASSEYRRLISRHASVLRGLSPEIREADLGASGKFYKLRLGSVADRRQASRLCNALIAAGEKDCLVRSK